ncbi:hypothetical protein BKA93DRAFT_807694 [Sparassis latifolia]
MRWCRGAGAWKRVSRPTDPFSPRRPMISSLQFNLPSGRLEQKPQTSMRSGNSPRADTAISISISVRAQRLVDGKSFPSACILWLIVPLIRVLLSCFLPWSPCCAKFRLLHFVLTKISMTSPRFSIYVCMFCARVLASDADPRDMIPEQGRAEH